MVHAMCSKVRRTTNPHNNELIDELIGHSTAWEQLAPEALSHAEPVQMQIGWGQALMVTPELEPDLELCGCEAQIVAGQSILAFLQHLKRSLLQHLGSGPRKWRSRHRNRFAFASTSAPLPAKQTMSQLHVQSLKAGWPVHICC